MKEGKRTASWVFRNELVNVVNYNKREDGTWEVKVYKHGWKRSYKFVVKDLEKMEVIEDEAVLEE